MQLFGRGWKQRIGVHLILSASLLSVGTAAQQVRRAETGVRQTMDVQEIVARMLRKNRQRSEALEHYTTDRTYKIAYTGTGGDHGGELHVHAEYLGGERKRLTVISQTGSPFLCNRILKKLVEEESQESGEANRKMMLTSDNYDVSMAGEETLQGVDLSRGTLTGGGAVKTWVLRVKPKQDNKYGYTGTVWISQDDFAIVRIVGEPAKPPSFLMVSAHFDTRYARHGEMWLPAHNSSATHLRFGGDANLTIDYGSYSQIAAREVRSDGETEARLQ